MSLTLYQSDNVTEFITTPSYASVQARISNQYDLTYTFNPTEFYIVKKIQEFVRLRNTNQTTDVTKNLRGKNIGDYTCKVKDNSTGLVFFARIDFSSSEDSNTRFFNCNNEWENRGRSFTLSMQEVEVW